MVALTINNWNNSVISADMPSLGACSAKTTNPPGEGAACDVNSDCPPNSGNPANRGVCNLPDPYPAITGELVVTRGDSGSATVAGLTVTVSDDTPIRVPDDYLTIQEAIDAAAPGSLILVAEGTYDELVVMWKPVRLQGAGAARGRSSGWNRRAGARMGARPYPAG